ncbi:hypothetical protein [Comamonas sp. 4034]|uniref:hypothetical protein n=1 Tax=Comamonas sp. 4034 TaxID=3156455 RepID=UPI003D25A8DD
MTRGGLVDLRQGFSEIWVYPLQDGRHMLSKMKKAVFLEEDSLQMGERADVAG